MKQKQILSNEEINELSEALKASTNKANSRSGHVRTYDFVHPDKLSKPNLRALQLVFSSLERSWSVSLPAALKGEATVQVNPLQQVSFSQYADSLPAMGLIFALSMNPLAGRMFIDMPVSLAARIADRMAGGEGDTKERPRPLTLVERNIIKYLLNRFAPDVAEAWRPVVSMQPAVLDSYTSANDLEIEGEELMLVAGTVWKVGPGEDCVTIAIPVSSLDPVLDSLNPQRWVKATQARAEVSSESVASLLKFVDLSMSVQLGCARVSVQDVLNMEAGDVVKLDSAVNNPLDVKIGGRTRFRARPGLAGKRVSIQIVDRADEALEANGSMLAA